MSKNKVWAVLEVSEEAKDEARKRAKLEKKKIGKWLSDLILSGRTSGQIVMGRTNLGSNAEPIINNSNIYKEINNTIFTEINELKLGIKAIYKKLEQLDYLIDKNPNKVAAIQGRPEDFNPNHHNRFFDKFFKR